MTREDINNIIQTLCPNDDDFEKPIISPAYLKTELEALALEQKPSGDAISRQAAFEAFGLSEATRKYGGDHSGYDTLMKYEIQDVLENLPPVTPEPQPCSNAIDRDEAIRVASGYCHFSNVAKELAKLPPVTPEPKMGRWVEENINEWSRKVFCSECGCPPPFEYISSGDVYSASGYGVINKTKYCPTCGIKMQEVEK